ncbi:MAG: hypothetical protein R3A44_22245 [Caldilineaceae bacterium]
MSALGRTTTMRTAAAARFWHSSLLHPRLLIPLGVLIGMAGYFGPWVNHRVAGLVILGLDLGEVVKFLEPIRSGQMTLWREGFYLPLLVMSLALSLHAFRPSLNYNWLTRLVLLGMAAVAGLNMLPPAWDPPRLRTPEFRLQTLWIALCLGATLISPFLALIPRRLAALLITLLALPAIWLPVRNFLRVLPTLRELYHEPLTPGWGVYVMVVGLIVLLVGVWRSTGSK